MVSISVVIPAYNEVENLPILIQEIETSLSDWCNEFEIIVVSDGSTDNTSGLIGDLIKSKTNLKVISHTLRQGKTAAWSSGVKAANYEIIVTLDGDGQDDPRDIRKLYECFLTSHCALVAGQRSGRRSPIQRKVMSQIGNGAMRSVTGTSLRDQGCGLKLFRRQLFFQCDLAPEMHRFFPLIAELSGEEVREVEVSNRSRLNGVSKYDWKRIFAFAAGLFKLRKYLQISSPRAETTCNRLWWLAVLLVSLFGAILRIIGIGKEGLWLDEYYSYHYAHERLTQIPSSMRLYSVHPPLYFLLLHMWSSAFGWSETAMRALSAIFGIATIPSIAILGRGLFNRSVGIIVALALCLSPFHLFHSQNTRPYSLMILLIVLSFISYFSMRARRGIGVVACYITTTTLLLYTHVFGVCTLVAQVIDFTLFRFRHGQRYYIRNFAISLASICLLFCIWISSFLFQAQNSIRWGWIPPVKLDSIWIVFKTFSANSNVLLYLMLLTSFVALISFLRHRDVLLERSWMRFLFISGAAPLVCGIIISFIYVPTFDARYMMQSFIVMLLLSSYGLHFALRQYSTWFLSSIILFTFSVMPVLHYYTEPQRQDWRGAVGYIESVGSPEDLIYSDYDLNPVSLYSSKNRVILQYSDLNVDCVSVEGPVCRPGARIWVIKHTEAINDRSLEKLMSLGWLPVSSSEMNFHHLKVMLYTHH